MSSNRCHLTNANHSATNSAGQSAQTGRRPSPSNARHDRYGHNAKRCTESTFAGGRLEKGSRATDEAAQGQPPTRVQDHTPGEHACTAVYAGPKWAGCRRARLSEGAALARVSTVQVFDETRRLTRRLPDATLFVTALMYIY